MKKKKAKFVAGTVAIAMTTLLSSPGIVAHADTFNVAQSSGRMAFVQFNDGYAFGCPTLSVRGGNAVNGNSYAYCIDHELPNPGYGGHSYSGFAYRSNLYLTDSTVRNEVNWLIANYTPSIGSYGGFNASQVQYYVKQAAIAYLIGEEPNLLDATYNNPVKTAIEQTINAAKQHGNYNNEDGNTNVSLSAPSTTLTYNPKTNTYDSAMITESYSSNAINKQQGESGFPSGTKFIQNGQALNNIPSNGNFYISIPANEVTHPIDNMRVAIRSEFNVVSVQMIQPNGTDGLQRVLYPAYTTTNAAQWSSLNFNVKPAFGKIQIVKTGVNGEKLSGAKFEVSQNGKVDATVTTDSNGIAEVPNLMQGNYQVKEVQAPTGYEINKNVYNTKVDAGQTDTVNVNDQAIQGKIQIIKLNGNTSTPLAGAKFGVYASDAIGVKAGTQVATLTTDANGFATTGDLNYGKYTIKEIEAPQGYFLNKEAENVDITQDKTYVEYVKDSPIQARLQVFKKDATSNKPLQGVQFEIINADTNKPVEFYTFDGTKKVTETIFTTNANGEIMTPQALPYGNYLLKEVKADPGYNNLTAPIKFSINQNTNMKDIKLLGNVFTMDVDNSRITGNIQVEKENSVTSKPIAGAEFKVTCVDGFEKGKTWDITSNANGIADLNNVQYGMYTVQEIKAPEGYVINNTPSNISIIQNGKTVSTVIKDNEIMGKAEISKTDATTGQPVAGAKIKVTCTEGFDKGQTWSWTSTDKAHELTLPYGTYTYQETDAPTGYNINNTVGQFKISENGQIVKANIKDQRQLGKAEITKEDATTSKPVAGAKIKVTATSGLDKGQTWTWTSTDKAHELTLPVGNYTWQETDAPTGYQINNTIGHFTITNNGITKAVIKDKKIEGKAEISKTDATTGKPVVGAKIKVTCTEGFDKGQTWSWTSTDKAHELTLPYGTYTYQETDAPTGYNINKTVGQFQITKEGQIVKANIKDQRQLGKVEITKEDATTSKPVAGAKIKVTATSGLDKGQTWTWTSTTKAHDLTLPVGNYTWQETDAPTGYQINNTIGHFTITNNGITKAVIKDKRIEGKVEISKTDATTGKPLAGAKIEVTATSGLDKGQTWSWTSTDKAHELTLPYGTYTYQETDAPTGYNINKTVGQFQITKEGQVIKANIKDQRQLGKAEITKEDATTSKPVAGAKIKVTATSGLDKGQTWTWTSTTKAHDLTLPVGNYTWQETDAPTGYQINNTIGHFTITNNGITKAVIKDKRIEGKAYITKINATNEKPVAGAKIKVTCTEGFDKGQTWSWTSTDQAHELTLPYGTYTYQETDAPAGYQINNTVGQFQITKEGQIVKATVKDYPVLAGGTQTTKGTLATTGQKSQLPFLIAGLLTILAAFGLTFGEVKKSKALKAEKSNNSTK